MSATFTDPSSLVLKNTDEAQRQFLREQCRKSLYIFCKAILGFRDFTPGLHLHVCDIIQNQSYRRKLTLLPRGFFKSHIVTIGYPIWLLIQEPNGNFRGPEERILIANATATNAEHFLSKIKSIFERNSVFQWLFPELIPDFASRHITWNVGEATVPRKNDYPEPTFSTAGTGAAVVSRHFTRIILDDLINEQHAVSPELMRKAIDWAKYTESLLEVTGRDEISMVGTRWSFADIYSDAIETEGVYSPENTLGWNTYIRKAIENDQPIFPERFDFKELSRLREKYKDYMFSCLYLNDPRSSTINDFNAEWLKYYIFTEKGKIIPQDGSPIDPNDMDRFVIVDIATSLRKDADYSAVVVVGTDENRRIFLLEAWRGRVPTKQFIEQIFKLGMRWHVRCIYYEDSATQKLIEYTLQEHAKETGQYIKVDSVKAGNKQSKEQRVRMVASYFQNGRVYIRESMTEFKNEYQDFPLGKHDDLIDAFAYFPRCARFVYPDPEVDPDEIEREMERFTRRAELDISLRGRSRVTGY